MKKVFFALLILILIFSCKKNESANSFSKCAGNWTLVLLKKNGIAQTIATTDMTIVEKENGKFEISGVMGENYFFENFFLQKNDISKIENFSSTKIKVSKTLAEFENAFCEFLQGISSYQILQSKNDEKKISLLLENKTMNAFAEFAQNSIFEKLWKLQAVNDGNAIITTTSNATLKITENSAAIFTGSNYANLGVNVEEQKCKIFFEDGPVTMSADTKEKMYIENLLLQNLFKTKCFSICKGVLSFYDDDTLLLEFEMQKPFLKQNLKIQN